MKHSPISYGPAVHYRELKISSPAFAHEEMIPSRYTCGGENISPPVEIDQIPKDAKCLAMIVDDPDASGGSFIHWLVWNIPVKHHLHENEIHGTEGINDFGKHHYGGPCPPGGTHRYFFKIYALDSLLDLPQDARKAQLERAMNDHILAFGELIGLYSRQR